MNHQSTALPVSSSAVSFIGVPPFAHHRSAPRAPRVGNCLSCRPNWRTGALSSRTRPRWRSRSIDAEHQTLVRLLGANPLLADDPAPARHLGAEEGAELV